MTYQQAIESIEKRRSLGIMLGLDRMRQAASETDLPQEAFRSVHIAGTNGKGSTATMTADALTACGYKTGLYTSPAVTTLRDTIQIDGKAISEEEFAQLTDHLNQTVSCPLSEFEFITLLTFCWFRDNGVDIAVIECGMGGKTDATNIIPAPLCAVFTPIASDHAAFLGNSIEEIAAQKSGIIKAPCNIVCAPGMNEEALGVIFEKAAANGLFVHTPCPPALLPRDDHRTSFLYRDKTITLSLLGDHQAENAITVLTVLERLETRGISIDFDKAIQAIENTTMPCRLELTNTTPAVLFDGAHNPHGIRALCDTIKMCFDIPVTLVIGMLSDKDHNTCLELLAPLCRRMYCCTPAFTSRALEASALADIARRYHSDVTAIDDPLEAFEAAKKAADQTPIVVGGSFYTASHIRSDIFGDTL